MDSQRAGWLPLSVVLTAAFTLAFNPGSAAAAADDPAMRTAIEEIVVSGLRGKPRTAVDSAVAVDVFDVDAVEAVSYIETGDILQALVPSYNISRTPIADGSTFVRPASLRGMPSHYTLVLVNGKRRHRTAMVPPGGSGTQGPDVATIPASAIQSIEVLRDGASSQYGSDAVAGVINFNLKENTSGLTLTYDVGEQYEGDGFQQTIQMNFGLPVGERGFFSFSGEMSDIEFTERAFQLCNPSFCIDQRNPNFNPSAGYAAIVTAPAFLEGLPKVSVQGDTVQPWGQPNNEALRFFVNTGYEFSNGLEAYGFANYSESTGDGSFFYRQPNAAVMAPRRLADGSIWSPLNAAEYAFPAGFTPRFEAEIIDYSGTMGVRGVFGNGINWDLSGRYGYSRINYRLFNTYNPSLGPFSGTDFRPGDLRNVERQLQADLSREFEVAGLSGPLVLAFGASYLKETFDVLASKDRSSYVAGPWAVADPFGFCTSRGGAPTAIGAGVIANGSTLNCANTADPVFTAFPVGSNGFPGYSPTFAGKFDRDSYAGYVDVSAEVTERWLVEGAIRYEDYSDFGSTVIGKVASRFYVTDAFAIRGSAGTGFRAPTPGQQGTINVSTVLPFGQPVAQGIFPPDNPAAVALGAAALDAEDTVNFTLGFTAEFAGMTLTVDGYLITIKDRVQAVTPRPVSATDPATLASPRPVDIQGYANFLLLDAAGVPNADQLGQVNYFTNAFDTRTQGIDVVATYPIDWRNGQTTTLTLAYNYNKTELDSPPGEFFLPWSQYNFERSEPRQRGILTAMHGVGDFSFMARVSYFGEWAQAQQNAANPSLISGTQTFDPEWFVDLEGSYQVTEKLRLTLGARNVFDNYPDQVDPTVLTSQGNGRKYSSISLVPWQGGYYYGRLAFSL
jgi:iron complex outermembrane receptor protein